MINPILFEIGTPKVSLDAALDTILKLYPEKEVSLTRTPVVIQGELNRSSSAF